MKKGIKLLEERTGDGAPVRRQQNYLLALRIALNEGEIVQQPSLCLSHSVDEYLQTQDDGYLQLRTRTNREQMIAGLFYSLLDMRVGGYRKVKISPHLAYGANGITGRIPPNAVVILEIQVIRELD